MSQSNQMEKTSFVESVAHSNEACNFIESKEKGKRRAAGNADVTPSIEARDTSILSQQDHQEIKQDESSSRETKLRQNAAAASKLSLPKRYSASLKPDAPKTPLRVSGPAPAKKPWDFSTKTNSARPLNAAVRPSYAPPPAIRRSEASTSVTRKTSSYTPNVLPKVQSAATPDDTAIHPRSFNPIYTPSSKTGNTTQRSDVWARLSAPRPGIVAPPLRRTAEFLKANAILPRRTIDNSKASAIPPQKMNLRRSDPVQVDMMSTRRSTLAPIGAAAHASTGAALVTVSGPKTVRRNPRASTLHQNVTIRKPYAKPTGENEKKTPNDLLSYRRESETGDLKNPTTSGEEKNNNKDGTAGKIKIESRKFNFKENAKPKIDAKSDLQSPHVEKKILTQKLEWKAAPKVGSLANANHKPTGGES